MVWLLLYALFYQRAMPSLAETEVSRVFPGHMISQFRSLGCLIRQIGNSRRIVLTLELSRPGLR